MRTTYALLASLLAPSALAAESPARLADSIISASPELADGPVQGYRATRSASATRTDTPIREIPQAISVVPALSTDPAGRSVRQCLHLVQTEQRPGPQWRQLRS